MAAAMFSSSADSPRPGDPGHEPGPMSSATPACLEKTGLNEDDPARSLRLSRSYRPLPRPVPCLPPPGEPGRAVRVREIAEGRVKDIDPPAPERGEHGGDLFMGSIQVRQKPLQAIPVRFRVGAVHSRERAAHGACLDLHPGRVEPDVGIRTAAPSSSRNVRRGPLLLCHDFQVRERVAHPAKQGLLERHAQPK